MRKASIIIRYSVKEAAPHPTEMKWRNHVLCANTKEARELSTPRSTDSDRLIDSASLGKVAWAQVGCSGLCRDCRSPRQNGKMREASQLGYSMFRCKSGPGELRKALCSSGLSTAMAMITGCTRRLTAKVKSVKACQVSGLFAGCSASFGEIP